jgi:hypothetical protein
MGGLVYDVFISYSRHDRVLAEELASDLKSRGYHVWWDAELVGSDDFYDVILQALNDAKAAIVIWTKSSTRSKFVRDEARFADHLNKLIAVKEPALDYMSIPFGFGGHHTEIISNREQIFKALAKLGVTPSAAGGQAPDATAEDIGTIERVDELVQVLGSEPQPALRSAAIFRLEQLRASEKPGMSRLVRGALSGRWKALLAGLTLRTPRFQTTQQGLWSAFGYGVLYVISYLVLFIASGAILVSASDQFSMQGMSPWLQRELLLAAILVVMAVLAWVHTSKLLNQKNFIAAGFIFLVFFSTITGASLIASQAIAFWVAPMGEDFGGNAMWTEESRNAQSMAHYLSAAVALLSAAAMAYKFYLKR